jgi:hypothetical protein
MQSISAGNASVIGKGEMPPDGLLKDANMDILKIIGIAMCSAWTLTFIGAGVLVLIHLFETHPAQKGE